MDGKSTHHAVIFAIYLVIWLVVLGYFRINHMFSFGLFTPNQSSLFAAFLYAASGKYIKEKTIVDAPLRSKISIKTVSISIRRVPLWFLGALSLSILSG